MPYDGLRLYDGSIKALLLHLQRSRLAGCAASLLCPRKASPYSALRKDILSRAPPSPAPPSPRPRCRHSDSAPKSCAQDSRCFFIPSQAHTITQTNTHAYAYAYADAYAYAYAYEVVRNPPPRTQSGNFAIYIYKFTSRTPAGLRTATEDVL
jgi:hypothetical protein